LIDFSIVVLIIDLYLLK